MFKLNNKGYMLVEIILAFVLAIGVTYFMFELIIKLKNKNDDLIVKTLVSTDQAIIYNTIMKDLYNNGLETFSCDKIKIENNKFKYNNKFVSDVSEYANVGEIECNKNSSLYISIPINVKQLKDNFDVVINYSNLRDDMVLPVCNLSVSGATITASISENKNDIMYYGWNSNMVDGNGELTTSITDIGTYTFYVKDNLSNSTSCSILVESGDIIQNCPSGYRKCTGSGCDCYYSYSAAILGYTISGNCTCRPAVITGSSGHTIGICMESGECSCRSDFVVRTNDCVSNPNYNCPNGGSLNGTNCMKYSGYSSSIFQCPDGFSTENVINNSYCWKIV